MDSFKSFIAAVLYCIGMRPSTTSFIDGETLNYGYGELYGSVGVWEYQIETKWILKRIETKRQERMKEMGLV